MITLVLVTYRNPEHLNRALLFYKKLMPDAAVVIADSNPEGNRIKNRVYVQTVTTSMYRPLHLEYDESISFPEKVTKSVEHVLTPYCILVGDDDFFSPYGIFEAMQFLKESPEYAFAYGHQYGFIFNKGELKWYCSGYYEDPRSFSQNDSLERLDSCLKKYTTTFYSVFRTDILKSILMQALMYAPCLVFFDNMFTMQALIRGKGHFLNKPFWFKEMSNLSTTVTYNATWLLGRDFEKNKKLMEKGLEENFLRLSLLQKTEAFKKSRECVDTFMETSFYSMYPDCLPQTFISIQKNKIKRLLPDFLKRKILFLKNSLRKEKIDVGQQYLFDHKTPYFREFEEVACAIKKSEINAYRDGFEDAKQL